MSDRTADPLAKPMCIICRRPYAEHVVGEGGTVAVPQCPIRTYYRPCEHKRRTGSGWIGHDGKGGSDMTCEDCGERFVW